MSKITTLLSAFFALFESEQTNDPSSGADAVREAVYEVQSVREREFTATLGEPDIVDEHGRYWSDPKVVIPIRDSPFGCANQLAFDLPKYPNDKDSVFTELLQVMGVAFEEMEELEGVEVPVSFLGGNLTVDWETVKDDTEKGGDSGTTEQDPEYQEPDSEQENSVNVEEETFTADGSDDE